MNPPLIIAGEPSTILRLPVARLRNVGEWSQLDSDILAHFLQVHTQISQSEWKKTALYFRMRGDQLEDCSFPSFQSFVFAAVYIRQLISKNDGLVEDAVTRFCRFADCPLRTAWLQRELESFKSMLDGHAHFLKAFTVRQLFDAFIYGAGLMHKMQEVGKTNRELFLKIYDTIPRHHLNWALHSSLSQLMNPVGNICVVIARDYSNWLHGHALPKPDVRWHNTLFDIPPESFSSEQ